MMFVCKFGLWTPGSFRISENEILVYYFAVATAMQAKMPLNYYIVDNAFDPSYDDFITGNWSN